MFLPFAGMIDPEEGEKEKNSMGHYWTGDWYADYSGARFIYLDKDGWNFEAYSPYYSFSIRPVTDK